MTNLRGDLDSSAELAKPLATYAPYERPVWGSDVMADVIKAMGYPYVALNPGATFRGLHDSLVNYGANSVEMIECTHEKIAVGIAHGFAKATGQPMAVILHNVVGLLHGALGIYYAYLDRVPVVVFGGSGPAAHERRRPNIDWFHSANVQGLAVREYTKWDHEPRSVASVPSVIARAHRVAMSEPRGPVYIALDAGLQEDELSEPIPELGYERYAVPAPIGPDPAALRRLAEAFVEARRPVIVAGYAGRDPATFGLLTELAELVGVGVVDTGIRLNFPNRHPLCASETDSLSHADCVLFIDVRDMGKPTQELDSMTRTVVSRIAPDARILDLGFNDLSLSSWSEDYAELNPTDMQVTADTAVALPILLELCRELLASDSDERAAARELWRTQLSTEHDRTWAKWQERVTAASGETPVAPAVLANEVWAAIKDYDWVLSAGTAAGWAKRVWDFDRGYRHPGISLGTATQIGISLGVALAHKSTGRLVVDLQPDGDLLFDAGALWIAAHYELPILVVMYNNRAYFNDWEHQIRVAKRRGTPTERAHIGMEIDGPAPDFAALARSFSWYAEGPVDDPGSVRAAVERAARYVSETGRPALVDVVCQQR